MIDFFVPGLPAAQGSKRYLGPGRVVESSKRVAPWRADVRAAAEAAVEEVIDRGHGPELWDLPVTVELEFFLPRPKGHYGTGRNAGTLKDSAPLYPAVSPDVDKAARAVLDAITGVVFADDKTVVDLIARKRYAAAELEKLDFYIGARPGVSVTVDVAP